MSAELFKPHISMSDAHSIAPQWFLVVRRVHLAGTVVCAFGRGEVEMVCGLFVTVFRVFKQEAAPLSTDHCQSHALFYFILKEIQTICLQNTVTILESRFQHTVTIVEISANLLCSSIQSLTLVLSM
jgi:hypothetical protein